MSDGLARLAAAIPPPQEWQEWALCRGFDVYEHEGWAPSWFPESNSENRGKKGLIAKERRALRICALCPVRRECLSGALSRGEEWGIWGGVNGTVIRKAHRELDAIHRTAWVSYALKQATEEALVLGLIGEDEIS